jgi:hypothetical protein
MFRIYCRLLLADWRAHPGSAVAFARPQATPATRLLELVCTLASDAEASYRAMGWSLVATVNFAVANKIQRRRLNPQVSEAVDSDPTEQNMKMTPSNPYSGGAPLRVKSMQMKAGGRKGRKLVHASAFL